jgi:hypothetical protein
LWKNKKCFDTVGARYKHEECVQDFDTSLCDALNSLVKNPIDHKGGDVHDA